MTDINKEEVQSLINFILDDAPIRKSKPYFRIIELLSILIQDEKYIKEEVKKDGDSTK